MLNIQYLVHSLWTLVTPSTSFSLFTSILYKSKTAWVASIALFKVISFLCGRGQGAGNREQEVGEKRAGIGRGKTVTQELKECRIVY